MGLIRVPARVRPFPSVDMKSDRRAAGLLPDSRRRQNYRARLREPSHPPIAPHASFPMPPRKQLVEEAREHGQREHCDGSDEVDHCRSFAPPKNKQTMTLPTKATHPVTTSPTTTSSNAMSPLPLRIDAREQGFRPTRGFRSSVLPFGQALAQVVEHEPQQLHHGQSLHAIDNQWATQSSEPPAKIKSNNQTQCDLSLRISRT